MKLSGFSKLCASAVCLLAFGVSMAQTAQKNNYTFKQAETPRHLEKYDCSTFYNSGNKVYTVRGDELAEFGLNIRDFAMSPAGTFFIVISDFEKAPEAAVFAPDELNDQLVKFKNKKIGVPSSATFSSDARKIYLAAGKRLNVIDPRTFLVTDTIALPFEPQRMNVSDNGYFLILINGMDVCVFNLEDKSVRRTIEFEDNIADAKFNNGSTEFAVLTTDGVLSIYDTRTFMIKKTIDDLEGGIAFDYNKDGKYVAVANGPKTIQIINLLNPADHETITIEGKRPTITFTDDRFTGTVKDRITGEPIRDVVVVFEGAKGAKTVMVKTNDKGKFKASEGLVPDSTYIVKVDALGLYGIEPVVKVDGNEVSLCKGITDMLFLPDSQGNTLLTYAFFNNIGAQRMLKLAPFYGKLVSDEAQERLNEWMKMMPGESLEAYNLRVNDETRKQQLRLFEDEISTNLANNLLEMSSITLGKYDRANQMLEVDFDNMPPILLPVPENDLAGFTDVNTLEFRNAKYGVTADDTFELIYAEVYNSADGKTYTYNNIDRVPLNFLGDDDNVVSIEVLQQQMMEEVKLQEIKENVVAEAKQDNVISDHTNIAVDSRVEPSYDANGNKILNYKVKFTYQVDPEFTVVEDFGPGKYYAEESGAATSMLKIVKQAFEGDFAQYLKEGKKLIVKISGTADATPIVHTIKYDGRYGEFVNEPVYKDDVLTGLTVTSKEPITQNEQLAFLRASGVKNYLETNVEKINDMNTDYQYYITVSEDKGSQYRRITAEFTFVDAF